MSVTCGQKVLLALAVVISPGIRFQAFTQIAPAEMLQPPSGVVAGPALSHTDTNSAIQRNAKNATALKQFYSLPLAFEKNEGQTDSGTTFLARSGGYSAFFNAKEVILDIPSRNITRSTESGTGQSAVLHMKFVGSRRPPEIVGEGLLAGHVNYFVGSRPSKWHARVPLFSNVRYKSIYPGTDLVFHGDPYNLEYDFAVAPYGDLNNIRLQFEGAENMQVTAVGDLLLQTKAGEVRFRKPLLYQESLGGRQAITGGFTIMRGNAVGFWAGPHDTTRTLTIDPVLAYATYFSGSIAPIAIDPAGNIYVAGQAGQGLPTKSAYQSSPGGGYAAFVTKFDPTGTSLIFSTYISGSGIDEARALAVDSLGNAYVTGNSSSSDFPTTPGAFMTQCPGICNTPFVAKFGPEGSLLYSTYTGGSNSAVHGIAVDTFGDAYITGTIASDDLPVVNAFQPTFAGTVSTSGRNAFVQKLDPTGSQLMYSTYLGGGGDHGTAIAVDNSGSAYVVGSSGGGFPTKNPLQFDVGTYFLTKFSPQGDSLVYSTVLGEGGQYDQPNAVAVDPAGNAYIAGAVTTLNYPLTLNAFKTSCIAICSASQAYVVAMNATGTGLIYATLLGDGSANGIAVDSSGNAYIAGIAVSGYFPAVDAIEGVQPGAPGFSAGGAFVVKLNSSGLPTFSTYLGGTGANDYAAGIAVDGDLNMFVGGTTSSPDFPVVSPFQVSPGAGFVAKVSPATIPGLSVSSVQPLVAVRNVGSARLNISNIAVAGSDPGVTFAVGGNCGTNISLAPGTQCLLVIEQMSPPPAKSANITVTSDAAANPQTFTAVPPVGFPPTLLYAPPTLWFPPQYVGTVSTPQTVTITNTRLEPVVINSVQISSEFPIIDGCTGNLAAGGSCTIEVTFQPSQPNSNGTFEMLNVYYSASFISGGPVQDSLFVAGHAYSNSISIGSPSQTFGSQYVGVPGMSQVVTLSNVTPAPVSLGNISTSGPFSMTKNCGSSLAAYSNCRIALLFAPTQNGFASGNLTVSFSGPGSPANVGLSGTGKILSDLAISPLSIDFGPVLIPTTGMQDLTLTNVSTAPITISSFDFAAPPQFSQANDCPVNPGHLVPGASCRVTLSFSPTVTDPQSGTLNIHHSGTGNPQIISLSGQGTTPLILQPEALTFGLQGVGTTSAPQSLGIGNNRGTPLTVQSLSISGDFQISQNPCPFPGPLAGFTGCALQIVFTPTAQGTRTGTFTVVASDEPFPHVATLTGIGGTVATADLSSSNLYFGFQIVGAPSGLQTLTLSNGGDGTLNIASIVASAGFTQTSTCASTLAAGSTCSISVKFAPTVVGQQSGVLTITDNAPDSPQSVALWGNATDYSVESATGTAATVNAGQTATYNLQAAPSGGFTGAITLNCSGAPRKASCRISPTSLLVSGSEPAAFTVTVVTTAPSLALRAGNFTTMPVMAGFLLMPTLPILFMVLPANFLGASKRRCWLIAICVLATLAFLVACGGGSGAPPPPPPGDSGTPPGTYAITVTASSGGSSRPISLSLTVK